MDSTSTIAVPVLGMHRSGTSMVSRMLEAGGVGFGAPQSLAGPGADNEYGYWENLEIRRINEELLQCNGGNWRNPPASPTGDFSGNEFDALREQAVASLKLLSESATCWSMKDPRMSLLLPFWQPLLPGPSRAVLCLRHPSAVATSLDKRNKISPELAGFLWQEYTASACGSLADAEVLVVSYEGILAAPQAEAQRCARFFASFGVRLNEEAMVDAVNRRLNHAPLQSVPFSSLDPSGLELYQQLLACASDESQWSTVSPALPPRDARFNALMRESARLASELDGWVNAYEDRVQETLAGRIALQNLQNQNDQQEVQRLHLETELEAERTRMDNLQGRLEFRLGSALRRLLRR
ncbi:MAG: hypothetical protein O3A95_02450 [Planctomycetota bacterium]|nr:hypothetical protein [Planctomycetota bacterium]MDA1113143.1 hypothetical protein [Planctomycetota bacterium]